MEATHLLPSLQGIVWEDESGKNPSLSAAQRLDFKRAKLDLKIVKRESSSESKYDLFQRLNSYGSQATPQEVRSCMLIGTNRNFYQWLSELAKDEHYLSTLALGQRLIKEQYHLELALRFLVFRVLAVDRLSAIGNLGDFLTKESVRMASDPDFDMDAAGSAFRKTFRMLDGVLGDLVFKRWNEERNRFQGAFLNTAFEVIGMGLGHYIDEYDKLDEAEFLEGVKRFWSNDEYSTGFATGVRADTRMAKSIPIGRSIFQR
ncbi:Uncharacterised protein [Mycobacteroides abscessus subsp. bolletii]|nr:Uncharacterised protein [Mycobacteroides abscessus subsp. bolletii]SKG60094.1 Uncharacterised protein [Mycobacteroides abscessus subsp. bolletii]